MGMDIRYANSTPLALVAFGITTILFNIHNAGFFEMDSMVLSMGAFYAGAAQVLAGIMAFLRGDIFCTTAFTSFGFFWWAYVGMIILPDLIGLRKPPSSFVGWFYFHWGVLAAFLTVGTLKYSKAKQLVFVTVTVLFFLLAIAHWTDSDTLVKIAGWEGICCGVSAMYYGLASVLNAEHGRIILPVGSSTWDPSHTGVDAVKPTTEPNNAVNGEPVGSPTGGI
ncbi:Succinate-acetate/proton symporter SatP [Diplonema papillatum]|nr:Succinate-acetate/proton symporter SatP [Diplonema papillatum]